MTNPTFKFKHAHDTTYDVLDQDGTMIGNVEIADDSVEGFTFKAEYAKDQGEGARLTVEVGDAWRGRCG